MEWLRNKRLNSLAYFYRAPHSIIVSLGLWIGLLYLPDWFTFLIAQIERNGSGSFCLVICLLLAAGLRVWQQRSQLIELKPLGIDRWLGATVIMTGIFLFPFSRFSLYSQALVWLMILIGSAINLWGFIFFRQHWFIVGILALTAYPNPGHFLAMLWQALLPSQILESSMAWATALLLRCFGQAVLAVGPLLDFPEAHVLVGWGCNGFDMVLSILGFSLLLAVYLQLSRAQYLQLTGIGIVLALLVNLLRLVLMSLAAVYWETHIFDLLHGVWGGQVFVSLLLVLYYGFICRLCFTQRQN